MDLSHNRLTRLNPETFAGNEKLRLLSLSHNPLGKLEAHQFPPLPYLRMLELVNCSLALVDKKAFMHLSTLQTLKLSVNLFTNLKPDVFLPLNKLKSLDLQVSVGLFKEILYPLENVFGGNAWREENLIQFKGWGVRRVKRGASCMIHEARAQGSC